MTAAVSSRRSGSPLEKDSDGLRLLGGRRIGSGRIISARTFEKDHRLSDKDLRDLRDRDRERDYKDKRFRVCPLDPVGASHVGGLDTRCLCTVGLWDLDRHSPLLNQTGVERAGGRGVTHGDRPHVSSLVLSFPY